MRVELELRNLPLSRVMGYLVEAGGRETGERSVEGQKWTARLEEMEPAKVGRLLRVRRALLIIEGDNQIVEHVQAFMRTKTMRGGG